MAGDMWFQKGNECYAKRQIGEAIHFWNEAVVNFQHPEACVAMGKIYDFGEGMKADQAKAFALYRQAAKLGSAAGMYYAGMSYRAGAGVEKNEKKAVEYFRRSHKKGYPNASVTLGSMYLKGDGVKKNVQKAEKYFQIGVRNDLPAAQYTLGMLYFEGVEVPENKIEGLTLLNLAAAAGHAAAAQLLQDMGITRPNAPKAAQAVQTPHLERGDAAHLILQLHAPSDKVKIQAAKTLVFLITGYKPNLDILLQDSLCPRLSAVVVTRNTELLEWILAIIEPIAQSEESHKQILCDAGILPQLLRGLEHSEFISRILSLVFLLVDGSKERKRELRDLGLSLEVKELSSGECDMIVKHGSFVEGILQKPKQNPKDSIGRRSKPYT